MKFRLIFFGTAPFSVPLLEALLRHPRFEVVGVVTQPDRPAGRKGALFSPPIKFIAEREHVPVFQFEHVKDSASINTIAALAPDVFAVASFGQIIPQTLLDLAPKGAINFHWSLLPRYRGASPIQGAIIHGDEKIGATVMRMDAKMDHGPILCSFEEPVLPEDTYDDLYHRLAQRGASLFANTILDDIEGKTFPREQNHLEATFVKLLHREDGLLQPHLKTAIELERIVRAYRPWPGTYLKIHEKRLKVLRVLLGPPTQLAPGNFFIFDGMPCLSCLNTSSLVLREVQPEGKIPMSGQAFIHGYSHLFTT